MSRWNRLSLRARLTLFAILHLGILITLFVGIESLLSVYKSLPEMQGRLISLVVVLGGMVLSAQWLAVIVLKPVKRMTETASGITANTCTDDWKSTSFMMN